RWQTSRCTLIALGTRPCSTDEPLGHGWVEPDEPVLPPADCWLPLSSLPLLLPLLLRPLEPLSLLPPLLPERCWACSCGSGMTSTSRPAAPAPFGCFFLGSAFLSFSAFLSVPSSDFGSGAVRPPERLVRSSRPVTSWRSESGEPSSSSGSSVGGVVMRC